MSLSVADPNYRREKLPEERATRTGFITRARDDYPRSLVRNESPVWYPMEGHKRTNTRPRRTVHLIVDELFTGIDWGGGGE